MAAQLDQPVTNPGEPPDSQEEPSAAVAELPRSRRAVLVATLGALAGSLATAVGRPLPARATAGDPLVLGSTNYAGSSATRLNTTSSGGAFWMTQNGYGSAVKGDSTNGHGAVFTTAHPDRFGVDATNTAAWPPGAGAAIRGTGGNNAGALLTTTNPQTFAVDASNAGATTSNGGGVRAAGGANTGGVFSTTGQERFGVDAAHSGATGTSGAAIRAQGNNNVGVHATSANGSAVLAESSGYAINATGYTAVRAQTTAAGGQGVWASNPNGTAIYAASTFGYGLDASSSNSYGIRAYSQHSVALYADGGTYGIAGHAGGGVGVYGESGNSIGVQGSSVSSVGVYGYTGDPDNSSAGYFEGPLNATIKNFRIDHPLDPAGKVLTHSCVESNERKLVYDGVVTTDARGEATVELPAYFEAINSDLRYQLTVVGRFAQAIVRSKVRNNRFVIATSEPATEVSWQVTGVRQDAYAKAHPLVVESSKRGQERGRYLNPLEHGQPESKGVGYALRQHASASGG
jgi:trimeric autotransporter adhesin